MIKYQYAKRLQLMIKRETNLQQREKILAKAGSAYHEKLEDVELRYAEINRRFDDINMRMENERQTLEQIEQIVEQLQRMFPEAWALKVEKTEAAQRRLVEKVHQREELNKQFEEIRKLKLITNTYINLKSLMQHIQGVAIIETENRRIWRPFCIEPLSHSPEQLQRIMWGESEQAASFSEAWEHLVFKHLRAKLKQQQSDIDAS